MNANDIQNTNILMLPDANFKTFYMIVKLILHLLFRHKRKLTYNAKNKAKPLEQKLKHSHF
ncbi:hypothetical protein AGMMS50233_06100 [Endomicrobiia bacterium]|nr:hypothetical protein AGMMS50233_06080 [Endomicrobiia bacterium]GHT55711.1 hypothetical protein AGMMS50233_06100 [Endomicrobiia bacterium]